MRFNEAPINRPGKFAIGTISASLCMQRFNEAPINRPGKYDPARQVRSVEDQLQ